MLADLAKGKLRAKLPQLERALHGTPGRHQPFLLAHQLVHLDFLYEQIGATCRQQGRRLLDFLVAAGEAVLHGTPTPSLLRTAHREVNTCAHASLAADQPPGACHARVRARPLAAGGHQSCVEGR